MRRKLSLVVLALLSVSSQSMAQIPVTAFKGVTNLVRKGKEQYSPTLGAVALSSLISDLRFNGNFIPAYDSEGNRDYISDQSKDPHWNVVKILFPSPTGTLSSETTGTSNFGKYVKDPKVVSELINFAFQVRQDFESPTQQKKKLNTNNQKMVAIKKEIKELSQIANLSMENKNKLTLLNKELKQLKKQSKPQVHQTDPVTTYTGKIKELLKSSESQDKGLESDKIRQLLKFIKEAVENELKTKALYPQGAVEQIILAFFVHKFSSATDILELYDGYDPALVDHKQLKNTTLTPLTKKDIDKLREQPPEAPYGLDDLYDLSKAATFFSPLPYDETHSLLQAPESRSRRK